MQVVESLLGTRAELAVTAGSPDEVAAAERVIIDEVARLEQVFTVFDQASDLHAYRRTGTTNTPELVTVVELASRWRHRTAGAFHPGTQPLIDLWDEAAANDAAPTPEQLQAVAADIQANSKLEALNLNAIAKGWIADRAVQHACEELPTVTDVWLSLGGDVVHRGNGSVVVGIEDPNRPYDNVTPLMTVVLSQEALATSGGSRRWWTIGGKRHAKVLDPRSGEPVDRVMSATIIAPDGATADVLATVALIVDQDELFVLADEAGAACLLIARDGTMTSSSDRFRP